MKNKKWLSGIGIGVVLIVCVVISIMLICKNDLYSLRVDCVQSSEDAIEIGKIICQRVYPEFDYNEYKWKCIYVEQHHIWRVFCSKGDGVLGGGLPEIHIKKQDAQVVYIGLSL